MLRPYAILVAVLAWAASTGGAFFYGTHVGAEHESATQAHVDKVMQDTRDAAQRGAADAIAALKPVNKTIVQKTQREIQRDTVYAACRVPIDGMRLANEAITGKRPEPAGDQQLPGADAATR